MLRTVVAWYLALEITEKITLDVVYILVDIYLLGENLADSMERGLPLRTW